MEFDFTTVMDRHGKDALAVDGLGTAPGFIPDAPGKGFDAIPMWVADMNFPTVPAAVRSIMERAQHPAFGYYGVPQEYYDAIIGWQKERNGVQNMTAENIGYENGVLGGVVSALRAFTVAGDNVLLHSPTYIGFTKCIEDNGRKIILSDLKQDEKGIWRMDYEDMDRKLKQNHIHLALFCSPHNPTGRVWERAEIEQAMEVYRQNDCIVISDEIWSDLTLEGYQHIPTQSVSEDARNRTIAFYAPSKTFNLAGLIGSYHIIYDALLRDRVNRSGEATHYNSMNVLSMHALLGCYSDEGKRWTDELRKVLSENMEYAVGHIQKYYHGISLARPQGTYMLYLDCEAYCREQNMAMDELIRKGWDVGVIWQDGRPFHRPYAIRMNLASPASRIEEAFRRLDQYVFKI
ncbi:MAG: aminotransferase class I/II-fold pyridoxal phosphate-dependent enzyme [Butyrivibrio sp.]|jgi:cystathionine beta-lyase|nr:aminotransferase class I/II-fold pyridoxal phosphate-dependent enzyme [Butyrivibrio sp.]